MTDKTVPEESSRDQAPYMGLARLMTMTYHGRDMTPLAEDLLARANAGDDANALMDLSTILQLRGDPQTALAVQGQALQLQQLYHLPAKTSAPALRLMAIKAPGEIMWNTPLEFLVEDSDISLDTLYIGEGLPLPDTIPDHDVMMVAIAQSATNRPLLEVMEDVAASWPRPVINPPQKILQLTRDNVSRRLEGIPGLRIPNNRRLDRDTLKAVCRSEESMAALLGDGDFPVIIRPVDSQAGQDLVKADTPAQLESYLNASPALEFFVSGFVDYRGRDGLYRKMRIALIGGRPYPSHMGISDHWMIHYLNAGMAEDANKRVEEARFMETFEQDFVARHGPALDEMQARLGLDYFAIDCAQTNEGELLVFEADSAMVVHAMDPIEDFPYKHQHMPRIFEAFRQLLIDTRNRGGVA